MLTLEDLVRTYEVVIGGGAFGLVKTGVGAPYDQYAVKFLYASQCPSAKKEYIVNKFLYSAYEIFERCNPVSAVSIVKPYDYVSSGCVVNCATDKYDCAVVMERLRSPRQYAVHLAFNGVIHPSMLNKIIYVGANSTGPPRGEFYDPQHIEAMIAQNTGALRSLEDITYRMGILDGICIFGARKIPIDAEYLLTVSEDGFAVTMIDFGMFSDLNVTADNYAEVAKTISDQQEYNLYYHPYSEAIPEDRQESCKIAYLQGFTEAFNCFDDGDNTYRPLFNALLTLYNNNPYL